jgi:hypothetical protein
MHVDAEGLRRIRQLWEYEGDAFALAALAAGPMRYSQLAHEMSIVAGRRLTDSTITRCRDRLVRRGRVELFDDGVGHTLHRLTELGHDEARLLDAMVQAVQSEAHASASTPAPPQ